MRVGLVPGLYAVLLALAPWQAHSAPSAAVDYELRPLLSGGDLTAIGVTLRLHADASGRTRFLKPGGNSIERGAAKDLRDLAVRGGTLHDVGDGRLEVVGPPGGALILSYRIVSAFDGDPPSQPMRPAIRPAWFAIHTDHALVAPEGRDRAPLRVRWRGVPPGWTALASLQFLTGATVADATDGYMLGGAAWARPETRIDGQRLVYVYRRPGWRTSPAQALPIIRRILAGNFAYWGDLARPLFVGVVQVGHDAGGRGMPAGFAIFAPADADVGGMARLIAHEHMHNWIDRQLGYLQDDDNREAWMKEGFTEAFASRSLLRSGVWTTADFVADLNQALSRYGLSPERTASNDRIATYRSRDLDVRLLPYNRGWLLAILWDRHVRDVSHGHLGLDDVLQAQRRLAADNAAHGRQVSADRLLPIAYRTVVGEDLTPQIDAFVEQGRLIRMPADLFGDCGTFVAIEQPTFERGFDLAATMANHGRVVGLVAGGPAERAGLREGDRIHVDERHSNDSQIPLTYRVDQPDSSQRIVTYKPEGAGQVTFQQFRLASGLSPAQGEACRRMFAGLQ